MLGWAIFGFFIWNFFNSMLRATLVAQTFEKPIDNTDDVLNRGANIYVADRTLARHFR